MAETRSRRTGRQDFPQRGEIFLTALDPALGHEVKKTRPTLVIQNDVTNRYGITTIGCMALSPIISGLLVSANERRELRSSEAMGMLADCVIPIIGGWIVQAAYDAHPEWNAGTGRPRP